MSSAADDLVGVVRLLVERPGAVRAEEQSAKPASSTEAGTNAELVLSVDPADRGQVIGRRGRTVDALRALARYRGALEGRELGLELVDD